MIDTRILRPLPAESTDADGAQAPGDGPDANARSPLERFIDPPSLSARTPLTGAPFPDADWKYVNLRRYFVYVEQSIHKGLQWVVFEPNDEPLWAQVRATVTDLLMKEWHGGSLAGMRPDEAFFVRCDRSTMTQNDIENGRLIVEIGIAPVRPAEFVVLRIGAHTSTTPDKP